jgi:hypothetical protein
LSDRKITDLTELTTPADGDFLYVVDVSDTTDSSAGSSKKIQIGNAKLLSVEAGITADTGSAQGGSPLTNDLNEISTCANAGDSVTLPTAVAGLRVTIINNGAQACDVFPASGDNLGAGVDAAASLASGSNITYAAYDATNWESV